MNDLGFCRRAWCAGVVARRRGGILGHCNPPSGRRTAWQLAHPWGRSIPTLFGVVCTIKQLWGSSQTRLFMDVPDREPPRNSGLFSHGAQTEGASPPRWMPADASHCVFYMASHATRAILIHGNGGSTAGDIWLPWVERLTALGLDVHNETFPDHVKARASIWLPHLESLGADGNTILIGHSSGALAAMRYAETHQLAGSILVGVCHTDLDDPFEKASGYYSQPWRWDRIRAHQPWIAIFSSADDPHIPIAEPRHVAAQLRCSHYEFTDRGHFVDQLEFPEIVRFIRRKLP